MQFTGTGLLLLLLLLLINFIILISDENNDNLDSAEISRARTQLLEKDIGKHTSSFLVDIFSCN